jgi:hypothetical protein
MVVFKKTNNRFFIGLGFFLAFSFFASGTLAHAATMYLVPSTQSVGVGQEFTVDVKIDTNDASTSINAAQATIQFPIGILDAVSVNTQSSALGFWLTGPTISNNNGTIQFIGGAIKGIAGSSLEVIQVTFKATGIGSANIAITNAATTAADGKGTNVLAGVQGASVAVETSVLTVPEFGDTTSTEEPAQVNRTAIAASGLPATPTLRVPLYPDQSRWYNQVGDTIVLWDVPADVTQVSASLSHAESNVLGTPETTLSDGEDFGVLQDGIWYITVRFKNNIGWGPPAFYKISLDTVPPLPFDINIENAGTDNPSPTIQFETSDSLSGIAGYVISVDGAQVAETTSTTMTLPPQLPGTHALVVSADDLAGNSVQDSISFQILPLPTPQITFVEPSVPQGQFVFATGSGTPSSSVAIAVVDGDKRDVFDGTVPVEGDGQWNITVEVPLAIGTYFLSATTHDDRGAQSLASAPVAFTVRPASVISFGIIDLGWFEILIIVILLVITGISVWSWRNLAKKQKRGLYNTVAGRDIEKLTDLLSANIKSLQELPAIKNATGEPESTYLIDKMDENVAKIRKYLKQELEKLK